jgi:membrane-bound lytic murein transglycosylase B
MLRSPLSLVCANNGEPCHRHCRSDSLQKQMPDSSNGSRAFTALPQKSGISAGNLQCAAFRGVTAPDPRVLEKARFQPEFTTKVWDYLDSRVNPYTIAKGREMQARHARTLAAIERKFGVDASVLLAIWSMESNFGEILTKTDRLHYVPQALATLAYADRRRAKFARQQLVAALKIPAVRRYHNT